jgi:hypothetical protein
MTLIQGKVGLVIRSEAREPSACSYSLAPLDAVQLTATPIVDFTAGLSLKTSAKEIGKRN